MSIMKTIDVHHHPSIFSAAVSPDGAYIAFAGFGDISILATSTGSVSSLSSMKGQRQHITCIAFTPDGEQVMSGSYDGVLILWSLAAADRGREVYRCGHNASIKNVFFTPDGVYVLITLSEGRMVALWRASGEVVWRYNTLAYPSLPATLTPDGRYVICGYNDRVIHILSVETGEKIKAVTRFGYRYAGWFESIAVTHDGKRIIATGPNESQSWSIDTTLLCRQQNDDDDDDDKPPIFLHPENRLTHTVSLTAHRLVTPDGRYIIGSGCDALVYMWSVSTGELLMEPQQGTAPSSQRRVAVSKDGQRIITCNPAGPIVIWSSPLYFARCEFRDLCTLLSVVVDDDDDDEEGEEEGISLIEMTVSSFLMESMRVTLSEAVCFY